MRHYAIALGSNQGDRLAHLTGALAAINRTPCNTVVVVSAWWGNRAVGGPAGQDDFLNGAAVVRSTYGPHHLLALLRRIETAAGRQRRVVNGPRTLDLDVLLCREVPQVHSSVLIMPHPRLHERDFVLKPLSEVAADWQVPSHGATVAQLWADLQQGQ